MDLSIRPVGEGHIQIKVMSEILTSSGILTRYPNNAPASLIGKRTSLVNVDSNLHLLLSSDSTSIQAQDNFNKNSQQRQTVSNTDEATETMCLH